MNPIYSGLRSDDHHPSLHHNHGKILSLHCDYQLCIIIIIKVDEKHGEMKFSFVSYIVCNACSYLQRRRGRKEEATIRPKMAFLMNIIISWNCSFNQRTILTKKPTEFYLANTLNEMAADSQHASATRHFFI